MTHVALSLALYFGKRLDLGLVQCSCQNVAILLISQIRSLDRHHFRSHPQESTTCRTVGLRLASTNTFRTVPTDVPFLSCTLACAKRPSGLDTLSSDTCIAVPRWAVSAPVGWCSAMRAGARVGAVSHAQSAITATVKRMTVRMVFLLYANPHGNKRVTKREVPSWLLGSVGGHGGGLGPAACLFFI